MLGGINNALFLQGISGFFALAIFILFLKWAFPTKKDPMPKQRGRVLKKPLRALRLYLVSNQKGENIHRQH